MRSSPHAPRNRTVGVLHDRMRYHTNKGVGVRPKGPDNSFIETEYKKVRPRSIPYRIWKRIRIISIELGLTIPDTLNFLADLYELTRNSINSSEGG